ncbi:MAG: uroporphyrinogen decarboxylase family protein [Anaerolineales bacterium]|nr:uroporphyrinogen decarboxylase family protein [Anaerolineales bacterium]MCX7755635.1 uroporphyrinogen decarboxylase family protein [Anaerolineales bacterium]MDW8278938.1 uroporphyrinogen decarboxylase family protein [Anaerolineales bacterium]
MNAYERFTARLKGQPVDRIPNFDIFMTFAAHYIKQPLSRYYLDHRVLVEANLKVAADFGVDILQAISDPYREAADFGLEVEFPYDGLPVSRKPLLTEPEDLKKLMPPRPEQGRRMNDRLEAIRRFREQAGGQIPIMGWVEGALAEACDLRSMYLVMKDLIQRPDWLTELLEMCVEVEIAFAHAQIEAGADIIGLGDAVCSQISPKMYRQFALPYEQRIFQAVHEMGAVARLHICGNTTRILPDMLESGADIIDLDWMVDIEKAMQLFGERAAPCGNFDPVAVMLQGTPEQVRMATQECVQKGGQYLFSAAGCEIPDKTPPQNLLAQRDALTG